MSTEPRQSSHGGRMLAPDRVLLLLSFVPYLRDHGPTSVAELAAAFHVQPELVRSLVRFLGTAGVPGETLSYQHTDLFDLDWEGLERDDMVSLTQTVAVDDAPRFSPSETAALLAGLHALTPVLPAAQARVARVTAAKLADALGANDSGAATVTADPQDPKIPLLISAINAGELATFTYRDASGRVTSRVTAPLSLTQHGTVWYLRATCFAREAERTFRVDHMLDLTVGAGTAPTPAPASAGEREPADTVLEAEQLVALIPERVLSRLVGFTPEILATAADGRVRVSIHAWHPAAAVQLVKLAPGEIVIESPAGARAAVAEWAERARAAYDD